MNHKHEPILNLDGMVTCRTCGITMEHMEEKITAVGSRKRADRVLQEIAAGGRYEAISIDDGFVLYSRMNCMNREHLTAQKVSDRYYKVIKRIYSKGVSTEE